MNYIILDLEFNQNFNFPNSKKSKSITSCPFEIIDIGAIKVDENFNVIGEFSTLIKPDLYKRLHPYVSKLTKYTIDDFKEAVTFTEAYSNFLNFIGTEQHIFCVWGKNDISILYKNITHHNCNYKHISKNYIDIQPIASKFLKYNAHVISLQKACELFGIENKYPYHKAIFDTMYTADIFLKLKPDKSYISSFKSSRKKLENGSKVSIDTKKLYKFLENKLGYTPTEKEKELALTIYNMGRTKQYLLSKSKCKDS